MDRVEGTAWHAISSLENTSVPSNHYEFACNLMIGTHSRAVYVRTTTQSRTYYRQEFYDFWGVRISRVVSYSVPYRSVTTLQCYYLPLSITDAPDGCLYNGFLTIHINGRDEKVCVKSNSAARLACDYLGHQHYTASVNYTGSSGTTTLNSSSSGVITRSTESCFYRLSCRKRCDTYTLSGGNGCPSAQSHGTATDLLDGGNGCPSAQSHGTATG